MQLEAGFDVFDAGHVDAASGLRGVGRGGGEAQGVDARLRDEVVEGVWLDEAVEATREGLGTGLVVELQLEGADWVLSVLAAEVEPLVALLMGLTADGEDDVVDSKVGGQAQVDVSATSVVELTGLSLTHQLLEGGTTQLVTLMNVQVDVVAQEGHGDVSLGDWLAVEALDDTDIISTDLDQVL